MTRDLLLRTALQSGILLLAIWLVLRLLPSWPASAKAWVWRLAFVKPIVCLLPFAAITLYVLPPSGAATPVDGAVTTKSGLQISTYKGVPVEMKWAEPRPNADPLLILWMVGAAGFLGWGARGRVSVGRIARRARPIDDPFLLDALDELAKRAGVLRPVRLLASPEASCAMLLGGRRATILLPTSAVGPAMHADARMMLAHEIAHLARRDLFWFGTIWIVQALFFFNPAVWLAAHAARHKHESATDRYAAELARVPIHFYADMLLRATVVARPLSAMGGTSGSTPGALPMADSYRTIHRRLEAMKHPIPQPSRWRKAALCALLSVTAAFTPNYLLAEGAQAPRRQEGSGWLHRIDPKHDGYSFKFEDYDVRSALKLLFQRAGKRCVIEPSVKGKVMMSGYNMNFESTLANMMNSVGGTYRIERGLYRIASREAVRTQAKYAPESSWWVLKPRLVPPSPNHASRVSPSAPVVFSCDYTKFDLRQALLTLFRSTQKSYSIDPAVQGTVTAKLKNVSLEDALDEFLGQNNATYRLEDGVYKITKRPPAIKP